MIDKKNIFARLSYHAVYDDSISDAIRFASKNGFSGIQIAADSLHLSFEDKTKEDFKNIKDEAQELGIRITIHAPDTASLVFPYSRANKGIMSYYADLIDFSYTIGAEIITIHPGAPSTFPTDSDPVEIFPLQDIDLYKKILSFNIKTLLELAQNRVHICIENVALEPLVIEVLQNYLRNTKLGLCWDFAKTYDKKNNEIKKKTMDFMVNNLHAIKQVHLHSIIGGKAHKVIQPGLIDFKYYLGLLDGIDVLDYCIEVRPREKAVESMNNLKKIIG